MNVEDENMNGRREQAEQFLLTLQQAPQNYSPTQLSRLAHELQVQQIELEMQNDELRRAQHELTEARNRYSDLFDFAPVGYFTLDQKGCIQQANLTGAELLGVERAMLIGQPFTTYVSAASQNHYYLMQQALQQEPSASRTDLDMVCVNGNTFPASLQYHKSSLEHSVDADCHIIFTDNSERQKLEQQRRMFFSIASHELRTPVTNMVLSMDMLATDSSFELPDKARDMIDMARTGARRLKRLVSEIMDIQKLESGIMNYQTRIRPLNPLLIEAVEHNQALASYDDIHLCLQPMQWDVKVDVDGFRLMQVLFNLISNAIRYSPKNGRVTVSAEQAGHWVKVAVSDQGPGVPESFQQYVFEPFAQADPSLEHDRHLQNLGLGLSIAKIIIERHGGHIGFRSEANRATTFYFELPISGDET